MSFRSTMFRCQKAWTRFHADERGGSPAVEMALIAPVFLSILFASIEISLVLFTNAIMDGAARNAARQIRTGQAQGSSNPMATFQAALCSELSTYYLSCGALVFDVRSFPDFSTMSQAASLPPLYDKNGKPTTTFSPGTAGQAVAARVSYTYHYMTPALGLLHLLPGGTGDDTIRLMSTIVFKNEPFGS